MPFYPKKHSGRRVAAHGGLAVIEAALAHYRATPSAPNAAGVLALTAMPASGTTTVTTGITQPDVPRNVSAVGNAALISGNLVVNGKNAAGETISETLVLNGTTTVVGNKAFKTIDSIVIPVQNAGGNQVSVGRGSKLGLSHRLKHNTVQDTYLNNVREGTPPTVAVSATALESNTILLNSALPGGQVVDCYYLTTE